MRKKALHRLTAYLHNKYKDRWMVHDSRDGVITGVTCFSDSDNIDVHWFSVMYLVLGTNENRSIDIDGCGFGLNSFRTFEEFEGNIK